MRPIQYMDHMTMCVWCVNLYWGGKQVPFNKWVPCWHDWWKKHFFCTEIHIHFHFPNFWDYSHIVWWFGVTLPFYLFKALKASLSCSVRTSVREDPQRAFVRPQSSTHTEALQMRLQSLHTEQDSMSTYSIQRVHTIRPQSQQWYFFQYMQIKVIVNASQTLICDPGCSCVTVPMKLCTCDRACTCAHSDQCTRVWAL